MYPLFAVGCDLNLSFRPFREPSHLLQNHLRRFFASAGEYPVHDRWNVWPHVLLELAQAMVGLFPSLKLQNPQVPLPFFAVLTGMSGIVLVGLVHGSDRDWVASSNSSSLPLDCSKCCLFCGCGDGVGSGRLRLAFSFGVASPSKNTVLPGRVFVFVDIW